MSTIERAMRILDIIAGEPDGVRVTDLATTLGLNRAIPHRLLAELIELGYVAQNPETERYRATFKLGGLGLRQLETAGISRWAQDELGALAATTRELVRLAVASDGVLRFVAKAQGADTTLILDSVSGSDIVLHATASGKAWLSTLPQGEAAALLTSRGLATATLRTETDLGRVLEQIAVARQIGYAVVHEEMEPGISAIAVPVMPPDLAGSPAVGTVSIAGPTVRLRPDVIENFAPVLRETAATLASHWHVYPYLVDLSRLVNPHAP
jgi:DNA-binding IclR family transcriptional regulator